MDKKLTWSNKTIPLNQIINWSENPRQITPEDLEDLKKSLTEYGTARTLTVSPVGKKFETIGGNMTLRALKEMGITECQCSVANRSMTLHEKRELALYLNHRSKGEGSYVFSDLETWDDIDFEGMGIVFSETYEPVNKEKEIDSLHTENECPQCGYKW